MIAATLALLALYPHDANATYHASDAAPLLDPMRPISRISRDGFTLQYWTAKPCETKIELRRGDLPRIAFGHKPDGQVKTVAGTQGSVSWHRIEVKGLEAGKRYFYRIWDPGAEPTATEKNWGAAEGWQREYAVSTQAPKGSKTIIRIPVKVLLMPNVVNVESAYADPDNPAPMPPKMTDSQIQKMRDEYAVSSRLLWVASGMRVWVDYQIAIDDRVQRWGPEPPKASGGYKDLPICRSYPGKDYDGPGGGTWTIVDMNNPATVHNEPIIETKPYSGQIEEAFPQKWNFRTRKWDYYASGGGTFGVDSFPQGTPGRSQYLGGSDTAWLATHEFHHDLESHGQFSLSNREDDRIVFDHPAPRHRTVKGDGSVDEVACTTNGRHGEHWDVIATWDRQLTDAQWLRMYFGYTETVKDADQDGFPDDDPRLPLDEKRFGSSSKKSQTDGEMNDLAKAMLSNWTPGPIQSSWTKPPFQGIAPKPTNPDTDGDGIPDAEDPYPLYSNSPFIPVITPTIDGNAEEWSNVPVAGEFDKGGIHFSFQQAHDENGYYGLYKIKGNWSRIDGTFDGEGEGVYSGKGVLGFQTVNGDIAPGTPSPTGSIVDTKPLFGGAPGLQIAAQKTADGMTIEFKMPNRGVSPWYWTGGGQEIGVEINVWDKEDHGYSVWEPYRLFYARMLEPVGVQPLPGNPPSELRAEAGVQVYHPGDQAVAMQGGWKVDNGTWKHTGEESPLLISGLKATNFDILAVIEAKSDAVLGGFTKANKPEAGQGYIGFAGGYNNTVTRLRIFGNEVGDSSLTLSPGPQTVQLTRRNGEVWLLLDGKPAAFAADPNPKALIDRLAVLGGYDGAQVVREIRIRAGG